MDLECSCELLWPVECGGSDGVPALDIDFKRPCVFCLFSLDLFQENMPAFVNLRMR